MATKQSSDPIFAGEFCYAIDDKNRVTIPSSWRRDHADAFFLVPNSKNLCLAVMLPEVFREIGDKVESLVPQAQHRTFMRHFYAQARHLALDKQGRLLLPDDYCKLVGLDGNALLVGSSDRFEIWNPESWKKSHEEAKPTYTKVADLVGL